MDLKVKGMRSACTVTKPSKISNNYYATEIPWKQVFTFLNYCSCLYRLSKSLIISSTNLIHRVG